MISRRNVLKSNLAGVPLLLGSRSASQSNGRREPTKESTRALRADYWNDWPAYLAYEVSAAREKRKALLASIQSEEQVRERIESVRTKVWEIVGGQLERTPLNGKTVGKIQRTSYRIEKVVFESQPKVYVTGNLYIPVHVEQPCPTVLSPLGHYPEGKSARNYQYLFQNLARKGYVVFTFDPWGQGERQQFLDPHTGRSRYPNPDYEHDHAGWPMVLLGATLAQYRVWDAVRALDYLETRPEVDSARIGCIGHSGGATMTMFLCALEPRLRAVVMVEGHFRNFLHSHYDPPGGIGDAEQNLIGSLTALIDKGDLVWAFAPKPALMCYTPEDGLSWVTPYYVESLRELFEEAKAAYSILGAADRIQLFPSFLPHNYDFFNRRETYRWLNRWLAKNDLGVDEADFDPSPSDALNCTTTGQVLTSLGGRSVVQVNTDRARSLVRPNRPGSDAPGFQQAIQRKLRSLLALPLKPCPLDAQILSSGAQRDLDIEKFEFRSEAEIRIPGWFLRPHAKSGRLPVVLYVSENQKDDVVEETSEMQRLAREGFAVCAVDLRGFGATSPRFPLAARNLYSNAGATLETCYATASLVLGKPVLGQRTWDFIRSLDYLEMRSDIDMNRLYVFAVASGALPTLLGSAVDDRPKSVLCERGITDFQSVLESAEYCSGLSPFVSGFLRHFDLPDVIGSIAPRRCWFWNAVGPQNEILPQSVLNVRLQAAIRSYSDLNTPEHFRTVVEPKETRENLLGKWLEAK